MKMITVKKTLRSATAVALTLVMSICAVAPAVAGELSANGKYYSAFESYAALLEHVGEVNTQTAEEGQVLLKNDGTLPMAGNEKVSVFGIASSTTVAGPTSNSAYKEYTDFSVSDRGPIVDGLEKAGFSVNPTLADFYAAKGFSTSDCGKETLDFTDEVTGSLNDYSQVGVIVLSRYGGEGSDLDILCITITATAPPIPTFWRAAWVRLSTTSTRKVSSWATAGMKPPTRINWCWKALIPIPTAIISPMIFITIYMQRSTMKEDWDSLTNLNIMGDGSRCRQDELGDVTEDFNIMTSTVEKTVTSNVALGETQVALVSTAKQGETKVSLQVPYQDGFKTITRTYGYQGASEFVGNTGTNYWGLNNNDESYKTAVANIGKSTTTYTVATRFDRTTNAVIEDTDSASSYGWDEVEWNDPRWDDFTDQISITDLVSFQGQSWSGAFAGTNSISASDGPGEAGTGGKQGNTWFCSEVVMASTWNVELIERVGQAYGKQCVRTGITSCYGPAMDTHRSPFGGRNFEYYSEDGLLSGIMCVAETAGIQSEGVGTFPSFNSQDYLSRCVDSLLPGGNRVEILIVNDGSKDNTAAIADKYAKQYPGIVRAIHQENGGHGAAVMTGLDHAQGLYFKVVDSDDKVEETAYLKLLDALEKIEVDLVISNYVYDKVGVKNKRVMQYRKELKADTLLTWEDCKRLRKGHYILMHSVVYRTDILKTCGLELPRHTFYVDNLYVFIPMRHVKTLYYLDVDFYYYFIGREDQSVNEQVMIKRIDQQLKVNRIMLEQAKLDEVQNKRQRQFLFNYLEIITIVSSILLLRSGTDEALNKKAQLWADIQKQDEGLYKQLRYGFLGTMVNLPGSLGRRIALISYKITQKVIGFS